MAIGSNIGTNNSERVSARLLRTDNSGFLLPSSGDVLVGGLGDDTLSGDRLFGANTFVISPDSGNDRILDFNPGPDKIGLVGGLTFESLTLNSVPDSIDQFGPPRFKNFISFGNTALAEVDSTLPLNASDFIVYPITNPAQYLASNPDLIGLYGNNQFPYDRVLNAATGHYVESGFAEGRPLDTFDESQYLASNGDLINFFGNNRQPYALTLQQATEHYIQSGFLEGRALDTFDEAQYLASNGDLINLYGNNRQAYGLALQQATEHYIQFGFSEGRSVNSFNASSYLNNNPDLVAVFGNNLAAATEHYIQTGFSEGRIF